MAHTQMLEAYPEGVGGIDKGKLAALDCADVCIGTGNALPRHY